MFFRKIVLCIASILTGSLFSQNQESETVLGIGPATIDLLIRVDEEFLAQQTTIKKGGSNPSNPESIEKVLQSSCLVPTIVPGGSAANTIRALAKLGERCAFCSCVGEDAYGNLFCQNMQDIGIEDRFSKSFSYSTSHVLCLITPDSQRTFLGFDQKVDGLIPSAKTFENLKWVHVEARLLRIGFSVEKIMQLAKESEARISIDLSSYELVNEYRDVLLNLISSYVDIVFCNEDEIQALTNLPADEGCLKIQTLCPIVVVTKGVRGCLIGYQNELYDIPTFPAKAIDTTGAGDLFTGGFLYGYLNGYPLTSCGRIGNRLGSAIVEVVGAELPEDRWGAIIAFLHEEAILFAARVSE